MLVKEMKVLVVEDEVLVAESVEGMLEDLGYTVVGRASNGAQAIDLVMKVQPDVILMDIKMPELNGLEASRRIFEICPTPIVLLTAYESRELVAKASSVGVGAYLTKPTSPIELEKALTIATARFADMEALKTKNEELKRSLNQLQGQKQILPICSGCKKIRDLQGEWHPVEGYFGDNYNIDFSHGMCPQCMDNLYEEYADML